MISSVLRLLVGIALLALCWITWGNMQTAADAGQPVQYAGLSLDPGSTTVIIGLAIIALIGAGFVLMGLMGLMKPPRHR